MTFISKMTTSPLSSRLCEAGARRKLGLAPDTLSESELIDYALQEPRLVRRPLVRIDGKAHFGADKKYLEKLLG